jgi:hypothetical protein
LSQFLQDFCGRSRAGGPANGRFFFHQRLGFTAD